MDVETKINGRSAWFRAAGLPALALVALAAKAGASRYREGDAASETG